MTDDDLEHEREQLRNLADGLHKTKQGLLDEVTMQMMMLVLLRRARTAMNGEDRNMIRFARQRVADGFDVQRELDRLMSDTFQERDDRKKPLRT